MSRYRITLVLGVLALALLTVAALIIHPQTSAARNSTGVTPGQQVSSPQVTGIYRGVVPVVHFDVSPPLRDIAPIPPGQGQLPAEEERDGLARNPRFPGLPDSVVQRLLGPLVMPTPIISFNGPSNACCSPPDPNGEVGPNHYVVMDNLSFQIFDKTGTSLFGPANNNTLWAGFGGGCQTRNDGDPVILYDQLADRWLLSQFTAAAPFLNCVALSQTSDPTGAYYRWSFLVGGGNNFGDYPKYGMGPDAYFISTREFQGLSGPFLGVGAYAGNRTQMLAGNPNPQLLSFLAAPNPAYVVGDGLLPADLDGTTLPPAGSDEYYMGSEDDQGGYGAPSDAYTLWKFHVDFGTPANSSFALANTLAAAPFNTNFPPCAGGRACVPQMGTAFRIDSLSSRQRPLFRLAYRNMGTYESLISNITVNAGTGPTEAVLGPRWFEVRSPASNPVVYQQGTYAPGLTDGIDRWMGSIAMDRDGNMALGYSASSAAMFPSIWYTGRLAGDPLGTMPQGEAAIINGTGSQTGGGNRWGDYSDMTVDPTDDCTFWYVHEYIPTTSASSWRLRIGAFKFPSCGQATPTPVPPTQTPTVVPATQTPISVPSATVTPGGPTPCPIQFTDVLPADPFYSYIRCLACRNIISGYTTAPPCATGQTPCYNGGANVTRGQVAKIVANAANYTDVIPSTQQTFMDVPNSNPFWVYVERAAMHSVISGYSASPPCPAGQVPCFLPFNNVTRGQMAKIDANAGGYAEAIPSTQQTFTDVPNSNPFWVYIERASLHGVISGYSTSPPCPGGTPCFLWANNLTRNQAAKVVAMTFYPNCQTPAKR